MLNLFSPHLENLKNSTRDRSLNRPQRVTREHNRIAFVQLLRVVEKRRKRNKNSRISHLPRYYAFSAMSNNRTQPQLSPHYAFSLSLSPSRQRTIPQKKKTDKVCTLRDIRDHLIAAPQKNRIFQRLAS